LSDIQPDQKQKVKNYLVEVNFLGKMRLEGATNIYVNLTNKAPSLLPAQVNKHLVQRLNFSSSSEVHLRKASFKKPCTATAQATNPFANDHRSMD
jgi:hypothetical protein